ncbi:Ankyrin repeat domain-containing protein 50 [Hondaea fermentalgiana]|uniref:Ankyrin repeat domain-containing protein 50 n=1 Tax=Hondaea fermentalgiana TaxID=2315210 RepID=A0A2R5G1M9_9STRA|nr:Ankyrin repeat domain-containing protein 50 [Hondaea fermentalgiana]|eukprot:GBG24927.1 Ankyrin repeat domain-containing protein 50 [Hondaea fermentalgiana]
MERARGRILSRKRDAATLEEMIDAGDELSLIAALETNVTGVQSRVGNNEETLLIAAARLNKLTICNTLIGLGVEVDALDKGNNTALTIAITHRHLSVARALVVTHGADIDLQGKFEMTPLMLACRESLHDLAMLLIERGANLNSQNQFGWTACMFAARYHQNDNTLRAMINNGADLNPINDDRWSLLMFCLRHDQHNIVPLLIERGVNLSGVNQDKWNPLHLALRYAQQDTALLILNSLVRSGVTDFNHKNCDDWTALSFSIRYGHTAVSTQLIGLGCDLESANVDAWRPIHFATRYDQPEIANLLLDHKVAVNVKNQDGWTPLIIACRNGQTSIAKRIILEGGDVDLQNSNGWTALMMASRNQESEIAHLIVAQPHANLDVQEEDGWTALHFACAYAQSALAIALLEAGANVHLLTSDSWTPLMLACQGPIEDDNSLEGLHECIFACYEYGADLGHTTTGQNRLSALSLAEKYSQEKTASFVRFALESNVKSIIIDKLGLSRKFIVAFFKADILSLESCLAKSDEVLQALGMPSTHLAHFRQLAEEAEMQRHLESNPETASDALSGAVKRLSQRLSQRLSLARSEGHRQRRALLHDQLQIAAEYWHRTENFETHWATQWSSEDVSRFISLITGSYPDALQLNGKQLLRLAIATHARHARVDNEDIANEFYELVISTIHRKRIVRLFLQKNPPENANTVKAPSEERDRIEALQSHGDQHGFYPHAPAKLQRLAPGTPVDFQVPGSSSESKWKQAKIVSVSPHDGKFTIAPNNGGKVVHGVLEHQVRISSFGKAPSTSHRHHPGSQSKRLAKRSRKRRDIFASLCVGDRIFARPHSGLGQGDYQPGVIVALHKSSFTADVAFDSGRAVAHMDIRDVRPHPSQQHAAQDHRQQESPRASGETESKSGNVHTRASTGAMPHGTPVQIIKSTESAAVGITGRVRRALEFGLRYDVMLSNGDTMHNVPVGLLRRLDAERDASSDASQNSNVIGSHSYVDAICDRYKQVLRDAAQSRPDGKELRIQFDRLDKNRTGQLEASDFLEALHDLGFKPSENEVLEFIDRMSERRDGFVTYEDFVRFALPHGIQIGQRQLKRPLAFYKASLESAGVLRILESALETRLGELWERLADLDTMSLGILQEDVFTRCLTRLGARASADQYSALTRTFADSDGKVDYREFAVVVEVLLVQKITNASVQLTTQVQSTRRNSAHDERMDKDGRLLGPMERKLRKEIDAATRIQALARRRIAQRSIAIQKRQQLRAAQVAEVWTGSGCEGSHIEGQGAQPASGKTFERHAQVIEEWRKLMLLNTRNGAEVMTTFRAMDRDCDGLVSLEELSATLCKYSIDARRAGMIMREMDLDNDGAVDLTDFKMFLAGVRQRIVARDTALASTQPAIHVMIDELGQDLCAKLRRYFAVLKRCGTDLLELLLYRPRGLTMTSVLRKQGFVLERPEWKRLEVHFASMADHRGDRSVCEDFVRLLGMSLEEFDQQQFSKHEHHLREYLQNTKMDSDGISGLGRLSHKVVSAIKDLCKDESRAESKHEALWWLLSLQEPGEPLTLDRVDLERFFRALKLRPTSFEMDHLFGAQSAEPNGSTIQCSELAKLFGISPRVYEYLEEDHMYSRFCRSYVMSHRARLRVEAVEAITFVRREGSAAFVRWLRDAIGVSAYRKFRAMVIAAVSRGVRVTSGAWLSERTSAKLGFSSSTQLERVLLELNFGLSQDEIRNLCRALVQAASGDVDLFAFADLCEVIYATAALGESGGSGKAGAMSDADDEAREKAREETERYLREVIQEYIRTPTGHRNLVQVFESFDTQRNGTLDQSELEAVFKSLGVDLAKVDTGSLLRHYDVNQDGQLSYHEFLEAIDVRVHPVAEETPKRVRYGQGKTITKATQIDLDLLRDKLEKYNLRVKLCREDVDDACARVTSRGLLSRRDVMDVLAALGLGHCLTDSEVYSFSRLTKRKFKAFLLDVVKGRFSLAPRDNARTLGTVSTAAGEKGSTSSSNASITADTKVVLKMAPHTGKIGTVVGPGRSAGTYEICLESNGQVGKILDNVRRSQLQVAGGRPMICENTVVIDKATQQRGIVIRFALSDPDHVDVRFQNMIRKHVASSTLEALPADVSVASLSRGRRVFARSDVDDQYFAGSILRVDGRNGSADVQFDHGERETGVALKHIKPTSAKTSA